MSISFDTIPRLTLWGNYSVDVGWRYLEHWLSNFVESPGLELQPDFQRAHVWDDEKRRRYVEFRIRGGRSAGELLWNCPGWNNHCPGAIQLVDGLQRLTAVRRFMADELRVFSAMDPGGRGYLYSEIEGSMREFVGCSFKMYVNDLPDRAAVLRWYLEINDGGVVHTEDELAMVRALLAAELR